MKIKTQYKLFIIISILVVYGIVLFLTQSTREGVSLKPAFGAEFLTRSDGYLGLSQHYGFQFKNEPQQMVDGLLYQALANGSVDIINAFSTDGRIPAYELVCLKDDKNFFPPYYAAPLIRKEVLEKYSELKRVINLLAGKITNQKMQQLNYQADEKGRKADDIAHEFLINTGLIKENQSLQKKYIGTIVIGSKEFTEQEILGEILAQLIKHNTQLEVKKRLNLGGTIICFNALKAGDIDLYPEYTGTGLVNILKEDVVNDPDTVLDIVRKGFKKRYGLVWLSPFGFNNTYTLTMRKQHSQQLHLRSISELASLINQN